MPGQDNGWVYGIYTHIVYYIVAINLERKKEIRAQPDYNVKSNIPQRIYPFVYTLYIYRMSQVDNLLNLFSLF